MGEIFPGETLDLTDPKLSPALKESAPGKLLLSPYGLKLLQKRLLFGNDPTRMG